ncbi:MAG: hypothetical protein ACYC3P_09140 [Bellilinea sp.]
MMQHVWSVLCKNASFDVQTNSASLLNIVETIIALGNPTTEKPVLLSMEIVSLWARGKDNIPIMGETRVSIIGQDIVDVRPITLEINLSKTSFHRTRITIDGFPIAKTGRYEFCIEYRLENENDWRPAARIPFFVVSQNKFKMKAVSSAIAE